MQTTEQILNDLKASIEADIRRDILEKIGNSLAGDAMKTIATTRPAARAKPAKPSTPAASGKRTPEEMAKTANDVLAFVQAHSGTNAEAIKAGLGVELATIELPIKKLLASKAITRRGKKRATRYYAKAVA